MRSVNCMNVLIRRFLTWLSHTHNFSHTAWECKYHKVETALRYADGITMLSKRLYKKSKRPFTFAHHS